MKTIRLWLATIATLLCSLTASAHDFEVDGIYYNITSSTDLTVSVTYQGSSSGDYNEYTGTISIPEAVTYNSNTYQVTSIGSSAFRLCNSLSSITIPGCVINIGEYAFEGCIGLKEIIFEDGKETISLSSNYSRKGLFYDCPLETLYLGRTLSYYASEVHGYSPFYNNKATITFVTIGNDVTSIGDYAFYGCNKLSSITIPRSVTSIGNYAFKECI